MIVIWGLWICAGLFFQPAADPAADPPEIKKVIPKDNLTLTGNSHVESGEHICLDIDNDGVVHIKGNDITVDFGGASLIGAPEVWQPNQYLGTGILISGKNITLKNAKVRGYKVGIHAVEAPGLVIDNVDVSGNYQQKLESTRRLEVGSDWLRPHNNDHYEWMKNYGAGIYVERSDNVTIRNVRAHRGQNGIILDRVHDSKIYGNDCSFLSGWGLALWRSSRNLITRNAFDFCIRGYSHGIYNRGQDSAGILMFEQCNENVIAENSATHCGDGLFGFGGVESLAGTTRSGNNKNLIANNDFSYAAAHGIEMTFSFDNHIVGNTLIDNAICGIWAGYSQDTLMAGNNMIGNGQLGYGAERGGINIEHGRGNEIAHNTFKRNACGIHLWWDEDSHLAKEPWVKANEKGSADNRLAFNTFGGDEVAIELHRTKNTTMVGNTMIDVGKKIKADSGSTPKMLAGSAEPWELPKYPAEGKKNSKDRRFLAGRQNIVMNEWGPLDASKTVLVPQALIGGSRVEIRVLGKPGTFNVTKVSDGISIDNKTGPVPGAFVLEAQQDGCTDYEIAVQVGDKTLKASGSVSRSSWKVRFYGWDKEHDPRKNADRWQELLDTEAVATVSVPALEFYWGASSPLENLPADNFALVAETTMTLPKGLFRFEAIYDDGVRVWVDDKKIIDDWKWNAAKQTGMGLELEAGPHKIRVEHFEIEGHAQLFFTVHQESRSAPDKKPD